MNFPFNLFRLSDLRRARKINELGEEPIYPEAVVPLNEAIAKECFDCVQRGDDWSLSQ